MDVSLLRKWIVEFIGTFFLVYVIGCVSLQEHLLLGPLAIGASLMVMIFAGGHISGAHYNPAVTLGVWIRGACSAFEAGSYLLAQVIGAIVASLAAGFLLGHGSAPAASTATAAQVILAEALGTFALVYTVLNVATAPATSGNSFYGLAIGFTVFAQAVAVGKVSGGAFNPAVAIGVAVLGLANVANLWIYWISEFLGAGLAAVLFLVLNGNRLPEAAAASREIAQEQTT
ncbi:MAG TPA: aquaporin [Chthoniobacterales bacterium]|nr:aquaporin [Chthoniobacterales bacterium]